MSKRIGVTLSFIRKALLATASIAAVVVPASIGVLNGPSIRAQSTLPGSQASRPSFEVASIKPGDPSDRQVGIGLRGPGLFFTRNATLKMMIWFAYGVRNDQISGGPKWLDSDRFSIEAKQGAETPVTPGPAGMATRLATTRLMLQSLLEDRFHLALHRETREEQVYDLVVAKKRSQAEGRR